MSVLKNSLLQESALSNNAHSIYMKINNNDLVKLHHKIDFDDENEYVNPYGNVSQSLLPKIKHLSLKNKKLSMQTKGAGGRYSSYDALPRKSPVEQLPYQAKKSVIKLSADDQPVSEYIPSPRKPILTNVSYFKDLVKKG